MCDKCKELKEIFTDAVGICQRQTAYNEYDKQRKKCAKEFGSIKGPEKKAEITVEKKKSKKKKASEEEPPEDKPEPAKPIVHKTTMKPEHKESCKKVENALNGKAPSIEAQKVPKKNCKYYYRGGLCANSKMDKPFCPCDADWDKCPINPEKK